MSGPTPDHLGTPLLATDDSGTVVWQGGFEPFGTDYQAGTMAGALDKAIYLRPPGQWEDGTWADATSGAGIAYNVARWIEPGTGRYTRPDPVGITELAVNLYAYVNSNPLRFRDPLGLRSWPFGGGQFCRDPSCQCEPPVKVLAEDGLVFVSTPGAGQCVEADAVYSAKCVLKIPDNIDCTLKCDPSAPPGEQGILECKPEGIILGAIAVILGKKPECFTDPGQIPIGWPPNPFWGGRP
jgi:RHS repeat-associated protein